MSTPPNPLGAQRLHDLLRGIACPSGDPAAPWWPDLEAVRRALGAAALRLTLFGADGRGDRVQAVPAAQQDWPGPGDLHIPCQHGDRTLGTLEVRAAAGAGFSEEQRWALEMVADRLALEAHHRDLEDALGAAAREAEAIDSLARETARGGADGQLLELVLARAVELAGAAGGALYTRAPGAPALELRACLPADRPPAADRVGVGRGVIGAVAESGVPARAPVPGEVADGAAGRGTGRGLLAVPLTDGGVVTGVLAVESGSGQRFTAADQGALVGFAARAARVVTVARLIAELQRERNLQENILAASPNGVIAVDRERRVLLMNHTARQFFVPDEPPGEPVGQPLSRYLPQPAFRAHLDRVLEGASERESLDLTSGEGPGRREYLVNIARLGGGGEWAATVVARDVTEQRKLDEEMLRMGRVASLGQLAAGIAHEIRNPLTGISITLDILREEPGLGDEAGEMIADISREIDRLEALIHGLLDFARPREQEHRPMRLAKALEWHRTFREQCRNKGLECRLEFDANPKIAGDPERLKQLFLNLAINAMDATEPGGTVTLRTGVEADGDGAERARVEVIDTGRGMDAETLAQVFDPFFTTKSDGTGLGLSIAHSIVEQHGGRIDVDSAPERGTTFRVELPTCP